MSQIDLQKQTIRDIEEILKSYTNIQAFGLYGSHAKDEQTEFSDIDIVVVFKDEERTSVKEIFEKITSIRPTLSTLYLLFDKDCLILFADGVRMDVTFLKPSQFKLEDFASLKPLHDPSNTFAYTSSTQKIDPPKIHWNNNEGSYIDWYFWMFRQAYCYACQSEKIKKKSFDKFFLAQKSTDEIRGALINVIYYLNGKRDYMQNIDPQLAADLTATYATSNVDGLLNSLRKLLNIYENVISRYCQKEKIEFPSQKVEKIRSLFAQFDDLR